MTALVVYGPQASGKTRHAEQLRAHFRKARVIDDWEPGMRPFRTLKDLPDDALVLTSDAAVYGQPNDGPNSPIHIKTALAAVGVKWRDPAEVTR